MPRTSFILGVALLIVATTLAVTITLRKPHLPHDAGNPEGSRAPSSHQPGSGSADSPAAPAQSTPAKSSRAASSPPRFTVTAPPSHPDHAALAEKAHKVEAEATMELDRLTKRLELTRQQRQRLFPILARTNKHYDPALVIPGAQVGAPALVGDARHREVTGVLDPPQRDQLIEDTITDALLWQEIIDKLRRRLDEETPRVQPAEPAEAAESPRPRGRGNLFDVVEP